MRRLVTLLLVMGLIFQGVIPLYAQQKQKISIAITDFQNTSGNSEIDYLQNAIPEMLITNLAKSGRLNIVERSRLQDAIKEMELGMSGIVDQSNAVEIGRAVGANAIMVGSYLEIGGMIRINARLIDVESSKVLKAESVQGRSGREIFNLMDELAESIEQQLVQDGKEKTAPKKPAETQAEMPKQVAKKEEPQKTTQPVAQQKKVTGEKKGGGHTALYILGGAALIGGGAAAVMLLGKKDDEKKDNPNSSVSVNINIPQ